MDRTTILATTSAITIAVASSFLILALSSPSDEDNNNNINDQTHKKQTMEPPTSSPSTPPSPLPPTPSSLDTSPPIRFPWEPKFEPPSRDGQQNSPQPRDQLTQDDDDGGGGGVLLPPRNEVLGASPPPLPQSTDPTLKSSTEPLHQELIPSVPSEPKTSPHTQSGGFGTLTAKQKQHQQKEALDFIASMTFAQGNLRPPSCPCCQ